MGYIYINKKHTNSDRIYHINEDDVEVVLSRLPRETKARIKTIYLNDQSDGVRTLGYTTKRGRREISICALPENVSLTRFLRGESPNVYGAKRNKPWPKLAVRRFLLYYVLLHEIGHLQEIDPKSKDNRRRYAGETKAHEFAVHWKRWMWSEVYKHPDVVHNPPTKTELEEIKKDKE